MCLQEINNGDILKILQFIGQRLDLELGTFELTEAYEEAINYAFRPGAVKAVVGVLATPCEKSPLPLSVGFPIHILNDIELHSAISCCLYFNISLFYCYIYIHTVTNTEILVNSLYRS